MCLYLVEIKLYNRYAIKNTVLYLFTKICQTHLAKAQVKTSKNKQDFH